MNPKRAHFKALSFLLSLLLLYSFTVLPVNAAAGTIYESESNNTYGTADITYDDYDTYGSLPTNDIVDWWKISITAEGMANFYLGNIPSGCDYDLQLYDYTGTKVLAESLKGSNSAELIKCHVRAGETYYIRVFRASYPGTLSSANYQLRVKRYDLQEANIISKQLYDYTDINEQVIENNISSSVQNIANKTEYMGYDTNSFFGIPSDDAYYKLTESNIYIAYGYGGPGFINLSPANGITAEGDTLNDFSASISLLPANALSNVPLVIYASSNSAIEEEGANSCGNFLTTTLNKGAFNVIAWEDTVDIVDLGRWVSKYMTYCKDGHDLGDALTLTNRWAETSESLMSDPESITTTRWGTSRLWATLIG